MAGGPRRVRWAGLCVALSAALLALACGKKGPPLAPLRLVPAPVSDLTVRRVGDDVELRFKLPTANANGPGKIDLGQVEIYAVTAAPGTVLPPNRDFFSKRYVVATLPVKPPPVEGEEQPAPAAGAPPDTRPSAGDPVSFTEAMTPARLTPAPLPKAPPPPALTGGLLTLPPIGVVPGALSVADITREPGSVKVPGFPVLPALPAAPAPGAPPGSPPAPGGTTPPGPAAPQPVGATIGGGVGGPPAAAAALVVPTALVRVYAVRGVALGGRPGTPSPRLMVPIVTPPLAPVDPKASFSQTGVVVEWTAPPPMPTGAPPAFNVYRADGKPGAAAPAATPATPVAPPAAGAAVDAGAKPAASSPPAPAPAVPAAAATLDLPINSGPLTVARIELPLGELGTAQCFAIRTVDVVQSVAIESDPSVKTCVTPRDVFPPAAPQGLSLLLLDGAIELVWDAGSEPDIAGYTVLRADAAGATLRPLTPAPVRESTFRDATVQPGSHYIYAVVAVDRAGNASPESARIEGTAR